MKKEFIICLLAGIVATTSFGVYGSANAECLDEVDIAFLEFMDVEENISYIRSPLYNENLEQNGWQYKFQYNNTYGFALIANIIENDIQIYEVEEVYYEQESLFDKCTGLPVYVTFNQYIEYKSESYFDLISGDELSEEFIAASVEKGFGYTGTGSKTDISETISYSSRTEDSYSIKSDLPKYSAVEGATNCANVAGSIVIGYYDRFCENLIPNFQSYRKIGTTVIYKLMSAEIGDIVTTLKDLMGTDNNQLGTTFTGFQSGMIEYVQTHGYRYNSESVLTGGNFDFSKYKNSVKNNKPVALFLNNYAFLNQIQENNGQDVINSEHTTIAHVVVGCGYKQHIYYNSSGQKIAERTYLKVASGFTPKEICYLNINSVSKIDKAISVSIS